MLTDINIRNFATVDELTLDFNAGFNVLTGETGAGKSIWIDAVQLALGERADKSMIRSEKKQCDICLNFNIDKNKNAQAWLTANNFMTEDNECALRRTITQDGKSKSTINGISAPLQVLREFSQYVIQIHGQHQQQHLLKPEHQRTSFDHYCKHETLLTKIKNYYKQWKIAGDQLAALQNDTRDYASDIALLRYQLDELNTLNLAEGEWNELSQTHQQLHNAKTLITQLNQALDFAVESEQVSASGLLQQAIDQLSNIKGADEQIEEIREMLNTAAIHLQEAGNELHNYRNKLDLSPENLATIETRLSNIYDIARKHHTAPEALHTIHQALIKKLDTLEHRDEEIIKLEKIQKELLDQYNIVAKELSQSRLKKSKAFNKLISQHMQDLGIQTGQFKIELTPIDGPISQTGNEKVIFTVQTNPNQPFNSLQKVVSGGELSRISLAIQLIIADKQQTETLIFDEVDVGIGGKTAAAVGSLLKQLGKKAQVLCITHLAQVAACGDHHYKVEKEINKKSSNTHIKYLETSERRDEIARMIGGKTITKSTLEHANEMLIDG